MTFQKVEPEFLQDNVFKAIGTDWMLVTAGTLTNFNTMTASWGGLGVLWNKHVAFVFVRPQRYTYEFMENSGVFTLSFFPEAYREALNLCGSVSGRDVDKVSESGLTPMGASDHDAVCFQEARLILVCRKMYTHDIDPDRFVGILPESFYPLRDYHRMYIGEIRAVHLRI